MVSFSSKLFGSKRRNRSQISAIDIHGKKIPSTLMGTSTGYFAVEKLDVKTTALIKFGLYAFHRNSSTIASMESYLKLGDSHRKSAFQSMAAASPKQTKLKDLVKGYLQAINGNHGSARLMFRNLCEMARFTDNMDEKSINNITQIGRSLNLSPEDMGRAIASMR